LPDITRKVSLRRHVCNYLLVDVIGSEVVNMFVMSPF